MAKVKVKKTPAEKASKKVVEEVVVGDEKSSSSTEFDGVSMLTMMFHQQGTVG